MHIIYLHQYFQTPNKGVVGVSGTRSYEFAKRFVKAGHRVSMITSLTNPDESTHKDWFETDEDGIETHWLAEPYENQMGFIKRLKAFLTFSIKARKKAASLRGDIIFATSTPLTIAIPALYASKKNKIPMVFEVRDLWPEAPRQMGVLTNPILLWAARKLELAAYRHSKHVNTLSPGMMQGVLDAGIPQEQVSMIPNSSDLDLFSPERDGTAHRERLNLGNRFTLAYFGTMGPANGLNFVLDAAHILKNREIKDIAFVLHGTGKERNALQERANTEQLDNVVFSDPFKEKSEIANLAAAADVCMTIYKNVPILYTCSPNKLFDAFAAGKPVLTNMPGWLGDLAEKEETGVFVEPDNADDFADKAIFLRDNPDLLVEMGKKSRALAETRFSRDKLAAELLRIIEHTHQRCSQT